MSQTITLILDLVIAGLLVATIVYAIQLNRQLIRLREGRGELEGLIRNFNEATSRAEAGIKTMRRAALETGEGLQKTVERASALRDELQFLVEAAESLARRLAEAPTQARGGASAAAPPPRRPAPPEENDSPRGRAQELLRVLAQEPQRGASQDRHAAERMSGERHSPERHSPERHSPERHSPERMPPERHAAELPRGRGSLTRGPRLPDVDEAPEPPRGRGTLTRAESSSRGARLADLLDTSQDLPRGRGVLTRDDVFAEPPSRAEGGRKGAAEPGRREGTDGLSRAERELLQAIESRR